MGVGNLDKYKLRLIDGDEDDLAHDGDIALQVEKPKLKRPNLYSVIMFNDDYTPMDFVVHILEAFFLHGRESATQIMLRVHTEGKAICGVFSKDVAETKAAQVNQYSQENEHPLLCEVEVSSEDESP